MVAVIVQLFVGLLGWLFDGSRTVKIDRTRSVEGLDRDELSGKDLGL